MRKILPFALVLAFAQPAAASLIPPIDTLDRPTISVGPLSIIMQDLSLDVPLNDRLSVGGVGALSFLGGMWSAGPRATLRLGRFHRLDYGASLQWLPLYQYGGGMGYTAPPLGLHPGNLVPAVNLSLSDGRFSLRANIGLWLDLDKGGLLFPYPVPLPELAYRFSDHHELSLLGGASLLNWRYYF